MQLTNAVVAAILTAGTLAAPHHHEGKRGSSLLSRARKFGGFKSTGSKTVSAVSSASSSSSSSSASASSSSSSSSSSFSSASVDSNDQWAGAGYQGLYNSGETLKGVSTTFNVLDATTPTDADTGESTYYASAWIGIDGQESCTDISNAGLWQAGVDSMIDSSGTLSFYACELFSALHDLYTLVKAAFRTPQCIHTRYTLICTQCLTQFANVLLQGMSGTPPIPWSSILEISLLVM